MKKIALFLGLFCIVLAFGSCLGSPKVFDDNIAIEQSAHLYFWAGLEVSSYNGIPVPTKSRALSRIGFRSEWRNVILPAGDMEFGLSVEHDSGRVIFYVRDVLFRQSFLPGVYTLVFTSQGGFDNDLWGVNIFSGKPPIMGYPNRKRLLAFAPFYQ